MSRGSMNPGFDQRIADWLEDDPDDAPDAVLTTVLAAFPSIPQRRAARAPWRTHPMNRSFLAGAAALTTLAVAIGITLFLFAPQATGPAASARPSTQPSGTQAATVGPSPSAGPALTGHVTSPSGDLAIRFPSTWTIRGSTSADGPDSIGAERVSDPSHGPDVFFVGWSVPLANGQSPEAWIAALAADPNQTRCDNRRTSAVVIGGHPGVSLANGCPILGGRLHYFAAVVVNGRGYSFHMDSRASLAGDASFSDLLAAVSFQP